VTLEAKDEEYWSVVRRLCQENDLTVARRGEGESGDVVYLGPGKATGRMPTSIGGGVIFQIQEIETTKSWSFSEEPKRRVELLFVVHGEPRARILKLAGCVRDERSESQDGEVLVEPSKGEPTLKSMDEAAGFEFWSYILKYSPQARRLKYYSCKLWAIREVKSEDWVIEDAAKARGASRVCCDLDTIKIVRWEIKDDGVELEMEIASPTGQEENLISMEQMMGRIRYENPADQPELKNILVPGQSGVEENRGKFKSVLRFTVRSVSTGGEQVKMPTKLMIRIPTEVAAVQIPVEFKDVELP
jgi:hypothetical protein